VFQLYGGSLRWLEYCHLAVVTASYTLTWFAFFLTFVVWFNYARCHTVLKADFGLTEAQLGTLAICRPHNSGSDYCRHGSRSLWPEITYSWLLVYTAIPCLCVGTEPISL